MSVHRFLLEEPPISLQPALAVAVGLTKAVVLQQLHWEASGARERGWSRCQHEGKWWCTKSQAELLERLPFLSKRTLERAISDLRNEGLVEAIDAPGSHAFDRSKWLRVNTEAIEALATGGNRDRQNDGIVAENLAGSDTVKMAGSYRQNGGSETDKVAGSLYEATLEATLEAPVEATEHAGGLVVDDFEPLPPAAPKKTVTAGKAKRDAAATQIMQWFRSAAYGTPEEDTVPPAEKSAMQQAAYDLVAINVTKEQVFAAVAAWPNEYPVSLKSVAAHWTRLLSKSTTVKAVTAPAQEKAPAATESTNEGPRPKKMGDDPTILGKDPETTKFHLTQGLATLRESGVIPPGAFDPDQYRDVLVQAARDSWCSINGWGNRPWEAVTC